MTREVTISFEDGKERYSNVPDDVTADMIRARVAGQFPDRKIIGIDGGKEPSFAETGGGAVTGIQRARGGGLGRAGEAITSIGGAGAMGGALGAMAPEVLTTVAGGLRSFPQGARIAPLVESAAIAAKGAGRVATGAAGLVSGLASETAGQAAEGAGAPQWLAEGMRFGAGAISPEMAGPARFALDVYKRKLPASIEASFVKRLAMKISDSIEGKPQDIDKAEADFLNTLVTDLRGGPVSGRSMEGVYDILQTGAQRKLALGEQEATTILNNTRRQVTQELGDALRGPIAYANVASQRISNRGRDALATAQMQRFNIGNDLEHTDIGQGLRSVVVRRNEQAVQARRIQYDADEAARNSIVNNKQSANNFIDQTPSYTEVMRNLLQELRPGSHSPDTQMVFSRILNNISVPEKARGVSFDVLDEERRRLGQVFAGQPPEGYAGISADIARRYYALISQAQREYAGEPQSRLLEHYAQTTEGLRSFSSKAGQKITALDKFDDARFKTDPASLPRQFFSTRQGVMDLFELTGNRGVVVQAASDFATNELRGMNERQVRNWMTQRRELLAVLPEVRNRVLSYANALEHGELTARAAENGVGRLEAYSQRQRAVAEQRAGVIEREGVRTAESVRGIRREEAISLLGPKGEFYPAKNVMSMIEHGTSKQWEQAAPLILASPGGKDMLLDSVKQVMSRKAMHSPKELVDFFDLNVVPPLTKTRIMKPGDAAAIRSKLERIQEMKLPVAEQLGLGKRLILQSLVGYGSSLGGRGVETSLELMVPR